MSLLTLLHQADQHNQLVEFREPAIQQITNDQVDKSTKTALNEVIKLFSQTKEKILRGFKSYGVLDNNSNKNSIKEDTINRFSHQLETLSPQVYQALMQSSLQITHTAIHISSQVYTPITIIEEF